MSQVDLDEKKLPSEHSMVDWANTAMFGNDWDEAVKRWELVRHHYPKCEIAWINGGIAEKNRNQLRNARILIMYACEKFSTSLKPWIALADIYFDQNDLDGAITILDEIREKFPAAPYPMLRLSQYYISKKKFDEAERYNELARQEFPNNARPFIQFAEISEAKLDDKEALSRWSAFREKFPEHRAGYRDTSSVEESKGNEVFDRKFRLANQLSSYVEMESVFDGESETYPEKLRPQYQGNISHIIELIWTKSQLNLKSEASRNYLTYFWWILDPLLYMTVFYVVFGLLLSRGGEGYLGYLLTGLVPFQWFAKTTQLASGSILGGKGLMNQVPIPAIFFPLVVVTQTAGKQIMTFAMLLAFLVIYKDVISIHWVALIPIFIVQLFLIVTVSCFVAMIVPYIRDLTNLVPTGIQFIMFASGIFYTVDHISEEWKFYFYLNPIANLIKQYRVVLLENTWPSWEALACILGLCLIGLVCIAFLYKKLGDSYSRVVAE